MNWIANLRAWLLGPRRREHIERVKSMAGDLIFNDAAITVHVAAVNVYGNPPEGRYVGMTIREAFAMAAMQGLLSGKTLKELRIQTPDDDQRVLAPMVIATVAAAYADALLVELEKERL